MQSQNWQVIWNLIHSLYLWFHDLLVLYQEKRILRHIIMLIHQFLVNNNTFTEISISRFPLIEIYFLIKAKDIFTFLSTCLLLIWKFLNVWSIQLLLIYSLNFLIDVKKSIQDRYKQVLSRTIHRFRAFSLFYILPIIL